MVLNLPTTTSRALQTIRNIIETYQPLHDQRHRVETSFMTAAAYDA